MTYILPAQKDAASNQGRFTQRGPLRGTCALRGCDPKKILRRGAEVIDSARLLSGKGIDAEGLHINWADLMKHKLGFTEPVPANMERGLTNNGVDTLHGTARFTGTNSSCKTGHAPAFIRFSQSPADLCGCHDRAGSRGMR